MGVQNSLFEAPVPQDLPGELDEIQRPQPFDVGLRPNVVDHHLADDRQSNFLTAKALDTTALRIWNETFWG